METTNDKESVNDTITNDDLQGHENEIEALLAEIVKLKSERQKCQDEFGAQRGKMKELFLQKEEEQLKLQEEIKRLKLELDDARSQLTVTGLNLEENQAERIKSLDELTSLQQLVSVTLEESSRFEEEVHNLRQRVADLERELVIQRGLGSNTACTDTAHSPSGGGDGGMLNLTKTGTMFTSLARLPAKLVSQLGSTDQPFHHHHHQQLVDDTGMKKAKEDADMLRSVVVPLEEEIAVLKTKLRDTDEQLQRYQAQEEKSREVNEKKTAAKLIDLSQSSGDSHSESVQNISTEELLGTNATCNSESVQSIHQTKSMICDMCVNYEAQLVTSQEKSTELERQVVILERYKDELAKEQVLNKQLESKWQESRDQHKIEVSELQTKMLANEESLQKLNQAYISTIEEIKAQFVKLTEERKQTNKKLNILQAENENLIGKHNAHSLKLQNDEINLPDNVERLHELWLRQREELIQARVGLERSDEMVQTLECLCAADEQKREELQTRIKELENDINRRDKALYQEKAALQSCEQGKEALANQIKAISMQLQSLKQDKKRLEASEYELRTRLTSLQTGLETGEAVQKDFVLLSQSLQKELERLRVQNTTLRWEHEEDVSECRGCEQPFKSSKGKYNCRHCGRIFCVSCLGHKVISGPGQRESRVCQVCHTLLNSETAPYFSTTSAVHPSHHHQDNK